MPPISKLEQMARAGVDMSHFVKSWKACANGSPDEAALLETFKCGFKTAYRVLGPKTKNRREFEIRAKRSKAGACKGDANYTKRRAAEISIAQAKWKQILKDRKDAERAGRDVYKGEMYPEGAPLRAVGL